MANSVSGTSSGQWSLACKGSQDIRNYAVNALDRASGVVTMRGAKDCPVGARPEVAREVGVTVRDEPTWQTKI